MNIKCYKCQNDKCDMNKSPYEIIMCTEFMSLHKWKTEPQLKGVTIYGGMTLYVLKKIYRNLSGTNEEVFFNGYINLHDKKLKKEVIKSIKNGFGLYGEHHTVDFIKKFDSIDDGINMSLPISVGDTVIGWADTEQLVRNREIAFEESKAIVNKLYEEKLLE